MKEIISIPGVKDLIAYIKVNDALHSEGGSSLLGKTISALDQNGMQDVKIFLDLKLADTVGTIKNTLAHYVLFGSRIGIVTISTSCSVDGICMAKKMLPDAKIVLVSLLTDISEEECKFRYNDSPGVKIVTDLFDIIGWCKQKDKYISLPFDGVVCSPFEVNFVKKSLNDASILSPKFIVPGIRDEWMVSNGDAGQQQRYTGVYDALLNGADFVVMGAQLTKGNPEKGITAEKSIRMTIEKVQRYFSEHNMQHE
ncbi:MAG: orotidine 5'-phosphate decarboxylase [Patescibacteria group bacterium]|nr:orotidine 5'-phosphate decarboxylase [Patescibacteria group bacterium]MDD4304748.1 orotidine 5'-phosphate decarboxylase [Patescibacteria group bacterium]MDD4695759.1 orotidine 5'-phosphate decarboxylase [Patescibacteria group bacterium]